MNEDLDMSAVDEALALIQRLGYARGQDLRAKLETLLLEIREER